MKRVIGSIACGTFLVLNGCSEPTTKDQEPATVETPKPAEPSYIDDALPEFQRAEALISETQIEEIFARIEANRERDNEWLIELNRIAAPPFQEMKRAERVKAIFESLGLVDVSIDEVGNVIARRKGTGGGKTTALVAHIDTVFPPWIDVEVKREGNLFTAPGVGDNTRGVVVLLAIADAIQAHGLSTKGDILFIGSVGEEGLGDLRGVRHMFAENALGIESFIAIDGGRQDRLVTSAVGSLRYKVTFYGPGGHSYGAFGRVHPHQALAQAITRFTEKATPITQSEGAKSTFSVGRIGGGTSINSIPFESWLEVDMRSVDQGKLNQLDAALRNAVDEALQVENERRVSNVAMNVEFELLGDRPAGAGNQSAPLVKNAIGSLQALGITPSLRASSTDANIPISLNVPAVTISRGGISRNAHAPNESWEDVDGYKAIQSALLLTLMETEYIPERD